MTKEFFLDCDTGIDDSLALSYLLAQDANELIHLNGIACTGGNVPTKQVFKNVCGWLELCGRTDIPVYLGSTNPLACTLMTCEDTHGPTGIGYARLPETHAANSLDTAEAAADGWIKASKEHPGKLHGLVIGPTTNLARAIKKDPELPKRLASLTIMGGALFHRGNTLPTTEWNVAVDPEALKTVLDAFPAGSNIAPTLATLDATESVEMKPRELTQLVEAAPDSAVLQQLAAALKFYFEFHELDNLGYLAHVHDPFTAAFAVTGTFAATQALPIDVELVGALTRGQVVADPLGRWGKAPNAKVLISPTPAEFFKHFIAVVGAWARKLA